MFKKLICLVFCLMLCGCQSNTSVNPQVESGSGIDHKITIKNVADDDIVITYDELLQLPSTTIKATRVSSSGEVVESEITGVKMDYFLNQYNKNQKDVASIYLTASDGYSVTVPQEFLSVSDLMIVYMEDGEYLDKDRALVKTALVDQRALYWVKFISEIEIDYDFETSNIEGIVIVDANDNFERVNFNYYGNDVLAISLKSLLDQMNDTSMEFDIVASDGLLKSERRNVLDLGYIIMNLDDSPLFAGDGLSKGMEVKDVDYIKSSQYIYLFLGNKVNINLDDLLKQHLLATSSYIVETVDDEIMIDQKDMRLYSVDNIDGKIVLKHNESNDIIDNIISIFPMVK